MLIDILEPVLREPQTDDFAALKRVFLESKGDPWITQGASDGRKNPDHNLVLGPVRTIRVEMGDMNIHTLDIDTESIISPDQKSVMFASVLKGLFEKNKAGDIRQRSECSVSSTPCFS